MNRITKIGVVLVGLVLTATIISYTNQDTNAAEKEKKETEKIEGFLEAKMNYLKGIQPYSKLTDREENEILKYGIKLLPYLKRYIKDDSRVVRQESYRLLNSIVHMIQDEPSALKECQEIVDILVQSVREKDMAFNHLLAFRTDNFSAKAKEVIIEIFHAITINNYHENDVILLIGIADIKSECSYLKSIIETTDESKYASEPARWLGTRTWVARLARARMGIKEDIKRCIELVESVSDINLKARMLDNLQYIRQPEVIPILIKYLNSSEATPRFPISCFAVEALSKMLSNFPIKGERKCGPDYTEEDIKLCRKWMAEQKEWKIIGKLDKEDDKKKKDDSSHDKDKDKDRGKDDKPGQPDKKESLPPPVRDK